MISDISLHISSIHKVLQKYNINFWLDAGTLLKTIRDGQISSAGDIDFGMNQDDMPNIIAACQDLEKKGFKVLAQSGFFYLEDLIKVYFPDGSCNEFGHVDFYIYKIFGEEAFRRAPHKPCKDDMYSYSINVLFRKLTSRHLPVGRINSFFRILPFGFRLALAQKVVYPFYQRIARTIWYVVPAGFFKKFRTAMLFGIKFNVPLKAEKYLKYRYGPGWIAPNKNWRLSDGQVIRFRPLRMYGKIVKYIRQHHFQPVQIVDEAVKGVFQFSENEIKKIQALDKQKNNLKINHKL